MPFTGQATVTKVSDALARITGLSLASGQVGTITLSGGGGDVELPPDIQWSPYHGDNEGDDVVDLAEACQAWFVPVADPGAAVEPTYRVAITKANGLDPDTFAITFTSFDTSEGVGAEMEIYVRFH